MGSRYISRNHFALKPVPCRGTNTAEESPIGASSGTLDSSILKGCTSFFFFFNFFSTFIYFWDRERESMNGGGAEREGDTESEAGSRLWAVSTQPDTGLEPTNSEIMTWAEVGCSTDWATQVPCIVLLLILFYREDHRNNMKDGMCIHWHTCLMYKILYNSKRKNTVTSHKKWKKALNWQFTHKNINVY